MVLNSLCHFIKEIVMQLFTSDLIRGNIANSFVLMKSCLVSYQHYKPSEKQAFVLKLDLLVREILSWFLVNNYNNFISYAALCLTRDEED